MYRLFAALLLLVPSSLHAASFDCSKARTRIEKTICTSTEMRAADGKLDQAYRAALNRVPEAAALVQESQREWLQSLDQTCGRPASANDSFADCLAEKWEGRTVFLFNISVRLGGVPFFFREVWLGRPCDAEPRTSALTQPGRTTAEPDRADSHEGSCDIHAVWPEAISNASEWKAWNKALLDEARRFNASQDTQDKVPDHWVRFADPAWNSHDLEVSIGLDVVSPSLVSATIHRDYTYAHPVHEKRAFNWLLRQHRELEPADLFRPNSGWETWIRKRSAGIVRDYQITALQSDPSEAEEIGAKAGDVAVQSRSWQIGAKGLSLIFTDDQFGYPMGTMMPGVAFSWEDLKPYLNPAFAIPR